MAASTTIIHAQDVLYVMGEFEDVKQFAEDVNWLGVEVRR